MTTWAELDRHLATRATPLEVWWRDDDAGDACPELDRLLALAGGHAVPLAVAVVPAWLTEAGRDAVLGADTVTVLQHGVAHRDWAEAGAKKIELGGRAPRSELADQLSRGRKRLAVAFGRRFVPVLVPPWNRIAADVVERLPALGFRGLSAFGGPSRRLDGGLLRLDTHVDPVAWRADRGFVGAAAALGAVCAAAEAALGPVGILSHHRVMNEQTWTFLDELLTHLSGRPAVRWCFASALFAEEVRPA